MSADNFVIVRKFDDGWYWAMGFATYCVENNLSFEKALSLDCFVNGPFDTIEEASNNANKELGIIEYGIVVNYD
jgi:hypothetical protein